jgi:hypothetical protein
VFACPPRKVAGGEVVQVQHLTAPSYEQLRPLKPARTDTFPVYPNLLEMLVETGEHPDPGVAFVMAVCSGYAYGDAATLAMMVTRLGLERSHCLMVSVYVDALFLTSVAYVIQSPDGRVAIVCYRGTPPTSAITWLTDLQVEPVTIAMEFPGDSARRGACCVHGGFYRNVRSTRYQVVGALARAIDGHSVQPGGEKLEHGLEALYITGHSLGGASATMLAAMLSTDPAYVEIRSRLRAVYTYGAPMIGNPSFAGACEDLLGPSAIRYVYEDDIVPQVPPTECGKFAHFGYELQFTDGDWRHNATPRGQISDLAAMLSTPASILAGEFKFTRHLHFKASIADHFPQFYIDRLTPEGVRSEFGD